MGSQENGGNYKGGSSGIDEVGGRETGGDGRKIEEVRVLVNLKSREKRIPCRLGRFS